MVRTELNHVSIVASDLDTSVEFYWEVFDFEPIPTPNFGFDVQWLEMADGSQLHLFELDVPPSQYNHFGVTVEDFEAVYEIATERDLLTGLGEEDDSDRLYALPDGAVQMYLEDPAGNVVEVNWPDVGSLPESIQAEITDRDDLIPQDGEAASASLRLDPSGRG